MPSADVAERVFALAEVGIAHRDHAHAQLRGNAQGAERRSGGSRAPNGALSCRVRFWRMPTTKKASRCRSMTRRSTNSRSNTRPNSAQRTLSAKLTHSLAVLGMYVALFVLCGFYIYHRDPRIVDDLSRLATLLSLVVVTVTLIVITSNDWRAETVPLMLFGMTVAIAYEQEIALLLSAAVTLVSVVALGHGLADAVVLLAATAGAILLLGRVRSRSKLLSVGFWSAGVVALTTLGVGTLEGEPIAVTLIAAAYLSLWAVIAGSLMTCLLPMVEKVFNVQTDLSLHRAGRPGAPAVAGADSPCAGHLQPLDHRRVAGRVGGRGDRRPRAAGARGRVFSRHRQDAQAGLLRRKPGPG